MENGCPDIVPIDYPCNCNYIPPAIKNINVKVNPVTGAILVEVNGDGVWRGATIDKETKTIQFSY